MWFAVKSTVQISMQLVDNCVQNTMKRDRQKQWQKLLVNQKVSKMFQLKTWVDKDGELTRKEKLSRVLVCAYLLCLVLLCWTPQYGLNWRCWNPGIQHFGRVVVLLTPFNSLTNFYQLDSLKEIILCLGKMWITFSCWNPLILGLLALYPRFRSWKGPFSDVCHVFDDWGWTSHSSSHWCQSCLWVDDLWTNT